MTTSWMALALLCAAPAFATEGPAATVQAFTAALQKGDASAAAALLAPEVLIYEAGNVEASRDEYLAQHLGEDIRFLHGARIQVLSRSEKATGNLAVVATRSRVSAPGEDGQPRELMSDETMVLERATDGPWRITHIHWSSRNTAKTRK